MSSSANISLLLAPCAVCSDRFDNNIHFPMLLQGCGHTFCIKCLHKLQSMQHMQCPLCRADVGSRSYNSSIDTNRNPIVNTPLLNIVSQNLSAMCKRHQQLLEFYTEDLGLQCIQCIRELPQSQVLCVKRINELSTEVAHYNKLLREYILSCTNYYQAMYSSVLTKRDADLSMIDEYSDKLIKKVRLLRNKYLTERKEYYQKLLAGLEGTSSIPELYSTPIDQLLQATLSDVSSSSAAISQSLKQLHTQMFSETLFQRQPHNNYNKYTAGTYINSPTYVKSASYMESIPLIKTCLNFTYTMNRLVVKFTPLEVSDVLIDVHLWRQCRHVQVFCESVNDSDLLVLEMLFLNITCLESLEIYSSSLQPVFYDSTSNIDVTRLMNTLLANATSLNKLCIIWNTKHGASNILLTLPDHLRLCLKLQSIKIVLLKYESTLQTADTQLITTLLELPLLTSLKLELPKMKFHPELLDTLAKLASHFQTHSIPLQKLAINVDWLKGFDFLLRILCFSKHLKSLKLILNDVPWNHEPSIKTENPVLLYNKRITVDECNIGLRLQKLIEKVYLNCGAINELQIFMNNRFTEFYTFLESRFTVAPWIKHVTDSLLKMHQLNLLRVGSSKLISETYESQDCIKAFLCKIN